MQAQLFSSPELSIPFLPKAGTECVQCDTVRMELELVTGSGNVHTTFLFGFPITDIIVSVAGGMKAIQ